MSLRLGPILLAASLLTACQNHRSALTVQPLKKQAGSVYQGLWLPAPQFLDFKNSNQAICAQVRQTRQFVLNVLRVDEAGLIFQQSPYVPPHQQVKLGQLSADGTFKAANKTLSSFTQARLEDDVITFKGEKLTQSFHQISEAQWVKYLDSQSQCLPDEKILPPKPAPQPPAQPALPTPPLAPTPEQTPETTPPLAPQTGSESLPAAPAPGSASNEASPQPQEPQSTEVPGTSVTEVPLSAQQASDLTEQALIARENLKVTLLKESPLDSVHPVVGAVGSIGVGGVSAVYLGRNLKRYWRERAIREQLYARDYIDIDGVRYNSDKIPVRQIKTLPLGHSYNFNEVKEAYESTLNPKPADTSVREGKWTRELRLKAIKRLRRQAISAALLAASAYAGAHYVEKLTGFSLAPEGEWSEAQMRRHLTALLELQEDEARRLFDQHPELARFTIGLEESLVSQDESAPAQEPAGQTPS